MPKLTLFVTCLNFFAAGKLFGGDQEILFFLNLLFGFINVFLLYLKSKPVQYY